MAGLNLERLSVLIVEDSPFIRSLLINSLKILGVGKVTTRDHGGEAIEFLKLVKENPIKAGVMNIDLIISNWDMSPVDGMMLLRWIRRHKDSPDRFIPFCLITSYAEPQRVQEARDQGITEFMGKPFTITGIGEKLISIVQRNRQFVHTRDYFGPDRRRRAAEFDGLEKRILNDKSPEVEIVHG